MLDTWSFRSWHISDLWSQPSIAVTFSFIGEGGLDLPNIFVRGLWCAFTAHPAHTACGCLSQPKTRDDKNIKNEMEYIHKHTHTYICIFSGRHVLLQLGTERSDPYNPRKRRSTIWISQQSSSWMRLQHCLLPDAQPGRSHTIVASYSSLEAWLEQGSCCWTWQGRHTLRTAGKQGWMAFLKSSQ